MIRVEDMTSGMNNGIVHTECGDKDDNGIVHTER